MRLTRAAQRAQQDVEEPTDAPDTTEPSQRALKEIAPNTPLDEAQPEEPLPKKTPAKKGKAKGAKKGKGKKAKATEEDAEEEDEPAQSVPEDEPEAAASLEKDMAVEDLTRGAMHGE
jgi:hypothetical protein